MLLLLVVRLTIWYIDDNYSYLFQSIPNKKYFICANLFNSERILDDWTKQVLRLTDHIGKDNVYISIFENGDSNDTTLIKLNKFREDLISKQINNTINTTKYYYKQNYTRIPFLASVRNGALNPLHSLGWDLNNTQVIFLNDIIFDYQDILKLIFTNNNDYDMACGMDFYDHFYDNWISKLINSESFKYYFPFLFDKRGQRRMINGDPFRVFCCWNGVASIKGSVLKDIRFRAHVNGDDSSECSLLCVDMFMKGFNKIIVNPTLKFFYEYRFYYRQRYMHQILRKSFTYFYYYFVDFFRYEYEDIDNFSSDLKLHPGVIDYINMFKLKEY